MFSTLMVWAVAIFAFAISVFCSLAEGAIFFHSPSRVAANAESRRSIERFFDDLDRFLFSAKLLIIAADVVMVALIGSVVMHRAVLGIESAVALGDAQAIAQASEALSMGPVFLAVLLATLAVLLFAEVLPRALAEAYADRLLPRVLAPMAVLDRVFSPILFPLHRLHEAMLRMAGGPVTRDRIADEIRSAALEAEREGVLDQGDASMIQSIIEFRQVEVREIMTPRTEMVCVEVNTPFDEVVVAVVEHGHSRIPVYEGSRDRIVGLVYAKDLLQRVQERVANGDAHAPEFSASPESRRRITAAELQAVEEAVAEGAFEVAVPAAEAAGAVGPVEAPEGGPRTEVAGAPSGARAESAGPAPSEPAAATPAGDGEPPLRSLLRTPYFVPGTKSVSELLKEFRGRKVHIAVVLDEYGGTAGLVTIEDILEEIVGEIEDEYDDVEGAPVQRIDEVTAEVDAKVHIAELNRELGLALPEDGEFETLGGFVMFSLGKIPAMGEAFSTDSVRFTVLNADARRVGRVRVEVLQPA